MIAYILTNVNSYFNNIPITCNLQPETMCSFNSTNSSNSLNKVLPLCRAAVLQLNHLTATPQHGSTAALQHRSTAGLQHCSTAAQ